MQKFHLWSNFCWFKKLWWVFVFAVLSVVFFAIELWRKTLKNAWYTLNFLIWSTFWQFLYEKFGYFCDTKILFCLKSWHFKIWPVENLWHFKKADPRIWALFHTTFQLSIYNKSRVIKNQSLRKDWRNTTQIHTRLFWQNAPLLLLQKKWYLNLCVTLVWFTVCHRALYMKHCTHKSVHNE